MKKRRGKNDKSLQREKAWAAFSKYIRIKYSDKNGIVRCVTCKEPKHWKEAQAGHYIQGRGNAILFEEDNVHAQCQRCNVIMHGRLDDYTRFMIETYGTDRVMELQNLKFKAKKYTIEDYWEMIDNYTDMTIGLCKKKGIE